jgi:hypothetical protein
MGRKKKPEAPAEVWGTIIEESGHRGPRGRIVTGNRVVKVLDEEGNVLREQPFVEMETCPVEKYTDSGMLQKFPGTFWFYSMDGQRLGFLTDRCADNLIGGRELPPKGPLWERGS